MYKYPKIKILLSIVSIFAFIKLFYFFEDYNDQVFSRIFYEVDTNIGIKILLSLLSVRVGH